MSTSTIDLSEEYASSTMKASEGDWMFCKTFTYSVGKGLDLDAIEEQLFQAAQRNGICLQALTKDAGAHFADNVLRQPSQPVTNSEILWLGEIDG
jgi:hypothetical protein